MTQTKASWKNRFIELSKRLPALKAVFAALCIISVVLIIHLIVRALKADAMYYSICYGIIFGSLFGFMALQTKISQKARFSTLGIFSGMGLDLFANSMNSKNDETITAVNSVGTFLSKMYMNIADDKASFKNVQDDISMGLWITILVFGLVLFCAQMIDPNVKSQVTPTTEEAK
ncbi:MAG: hypothetical protein AAGA77_13845 [Bacteroidota bacterium]